MAKFTGYEYAIKVRVDGDYYTPDGPEFYPLADVVKDAVRENLAGEATVSVTVDGETWFADGRREG